MATLTIHLPDDKHNRLKELAKTRGISLNKLIEELSTLALAEFDTQTQFKAMGASGNPSEGLQLLTKLDSILKNSRLQSSANALAQEAKERGLTPEILEQLLADDE